MHEWALAESVITAALDAAKKEHLTTITEITVDIGELQQIERTIFRFALKELAPAQHPQLKAVKFHLTTEKSTLRCNICGNEWTYQEMKKNLDAKEAESIHFLPEAVLVHARCPRCGSPDFELKTGRGVTLRTIKGTR